MKALLWICLAVVVVFIPICAVLLVLFWPTAAAVLVLRDENDGFCLAAVGQIVWFGVIAWIVLSGVS